LHPDVNGNCTLKLGTGMLENNYEIIQPIDGSAINGKFPCGREQTNYEGKTIKLPLNLTCDSCTLQLTWETKASGKMHMCSDI